MPQPTPTGEAIRVDAPDRRPSGTRIVRPGLSARARQLSFCTARLASLPDQLNVRLTERALRYRAIATFLRSIVERFSRMRGLSRLVAVVATNSRKIRLFTRNAPALALHVPPGRKGDPVAAFLRRSTARHEARVASTSTGCGYNPLRRNEQILRNSPSHDPSPLAPF